MIHLVAKEVLRQYQCKSFIETGTFEGDTLALVESWMPELPHLKSLYGVDLWDKAIEMTQKRVKHTQLFEDNSVNWLKTFVPQMESPAFYFLDAHTFGWLPAEQQEISNSYSPNNQLYIQELEILMKSSGPFVICIDDWNAEYNLSQSKHLIDHVWVTTSNSPTVCDINGNVRGIGRPSCYFVKGLDETILRDLELQREE